MRFHFYTLVVVLLSGLLLQLDNRDMLVLIFAITLVIVAEMINTAIEAVVDMITENYNPIAKLAKDVAAGAVLVAAMNAVFRTTKDRTDSDAVKRNRRSERDPFCCGWDRVAYFDRNYVEAVEQHRQPLAWGHYQRS
jgi:hypothetical protein